MANQSINVGLVAILLLVFMVGLSIVVRIVELICVYMVSIKVYVKRV